jgi:hypothetical protein
MDIEHVRATLQAMVSEGGRSVQWLSQEIRVSQMTLGRFLNGITAEPQRVAWERMAAYVASLKPPTAAEARGMLRVINRMRIELDTLEAQARSVGVGSGVSAPTVLGAFTDEHPATPPAPAARPASTRSARRQAKG